MAEYRLPEQKYTEAEYLFQTIEMAKSDEEYDVELCASPPPSAGLVDLEQQPIFSWKVVKRRQRPHRRYTVSHGGGGAPPAPPSTPTSLTASSGNGTPTPAPSPTSTTVSAAAAAVDDDHYSLLYILDYFPKYKKKIEQQRTDAELAELFNVITITGAGGGDSASSSSKLPPERGISAASRVIRKHDATTKIFKIHRNPKEFFREKTTAAAAADADIGDDNSVSAPEYDDTADGEEPDTRNRRLARLKPSSRRMLQSKRQRRFARFEHQERMDAVIDTFDAAMCFKDGSRGGDIYAGLDAVVAGGQAQGHSLRRTSPFTINHTANGY